MDEKTYVPSLMLNPTQAAAQEAPAAPQLVVEEEKPAVEPEKLDIDRLSPEEQAAVREFAKQIDVTDTNLVLSYGAAAQKNIADFSGAALGKVRTKDMGEVGDMLTSLVVELKDLDYDEAEQKKGLRGLFKKASRSMEETKAKFDKAEINVDKITQQLQNHQVVLAKDIAFDRFYMGRSGKSGIGLALTKEIVHLHRGTIRAYNGDGGAVFEITLPMGR